LLDSMDRFAIDDGSIDAKRPSAGRPLPQPASPATREYVEVLRS
jgi:hypothetical protein